MTIIELNQGYYGDLTGTPREEALAAFAKRDEEFLERHPDAKPYHRPCWNEREVPDTAQAPWGHEWYIVDKAGLLKMHSAEYDSSG